MPPDIDFMQKMAEAMFRQAYGEKPVEAPKFFCQRRNTLFLYRSAHGKKKILKIFRPGKEGDSLVGDLRLQKELLDEIGPDRVVSMEHVISYEGHLGIIMEYIDGMNLEQWIENQGKKIAPSQALNMMRQIGSTMSLVHRRGLIHRDLKPSNVLIRSGDGKPQISDFELATCADRVFTGDMPEGTLGYMPPEQMEAKRRCSKSVDVFAMGVMLYEMVVGRHPYPFCESFSAYYHALQKGPASFPEVWDSKGDMAYILSTALEFNPRNRYQDAEQFTRDIECILQGRRIQRTTGRKWRFFKKRHEYAGRAVLAFGLVGAASLLFIILSWAAKHSFEVITSKNQSESAARKIEEIYREVKAHPLYRTWKKMEDLQPTQVENWEKEIAQSYAGLLPFLRHAAELTQEKVHRQRWAGILKEFIDFALWQNRFDSAQIGLGFGKGLLTPNEIQEKGQMIEERRLAVLGKEIDEILEEMTGQKEVGETLYHKRENPLSQEEKSLAQETSFDVYSTYVREDSSIGKYRMLDRVNIAMCMHYYLIYGQKRERSISFPIYSARLYMSTGGEERKIAYLKGRYRNIKRELEKKRNSLEILQKIKIALGMHYLVRHQQNVHRENVGTFVTWLRLVSLLRSSELQEEVIERMATIPLPNRYSIRAMLLSLPHPKAVEFLSHQELTSEICHELRAMGKQAASLVPVLIQGLDHRNWEVRKHSAMALGSIGKEAREAIPALIVALQNQNPEVRKHSAMALGSIGKEAREAIPALIVALKDTDSKVRAGVVMVLGGIGSEAKEAIPALIEALQDQDPKVRRYATEALGRIVKDAREAIPALIEAFQDRDKEVKGAAIRALGNSGEKKVAQALIGVLDDPDSTVISGAISALATLREEMKEPLSSLIDSLKDPHWGMRGSAALALGWTRKEIKEAVPLLIGLLKDAHPVARAHAALALGRVGKGEKETLPALIGALQDQEKQVRHWAVSSLGGMGKEAVPCLIGALKDRDAVVRGVAATRLGLMNAKEAIPDLIFLLQEERGSYAKHCALSSLANMGKEAVPFLISLLRTDCNSRSDVAYALSRMGKEAQGAIPTLIDYLKEPDWNVRRSVAAALTSISEESDSVSTLTNHVPRFLDMVDTDTNSALAFLGFLVLAEK